MFLFVNNNSGFLFLVSDFVRQVIYRLYDLLFRALPEKRNIIKFGRPVFDNSIIRATLTTNTMKFTANIREDSMIVPEDSETTMKFSPIEPQEGFYKLEETDNKIKFAKLDEDAQTEETAEENTIEFKEEDDG